MTNAVAFGSMWASDYRGLSSMGKMALLLVCTMASAVLFQPVLMGRARKPLPDAGPAAHRMRRPNDRQQARTSTGR